MASFPSPESHATSDNVEKRYVSGKSGNGSTAAVHYGDRVDRVTRESSSSSGPRESKWRLWRKYQDGEKTRWWFSSTAVPLLAATIGPLANLSSIAALVSPWREIVLIDGEFVPEYDGVPIRDPIWCYWLNVGSLICGFAGNMFLLLTFVQRARYLIALPLTIIFWYLATGLLMGITLSMNIYARPSRPDQTYTQAYWYAVSAAVFYMFCSIILMINMLGYFLGHYPDKFKLTDAQRTLILQTMMLFIWLAGGAAVFSKIEQDAGQTGWEYSDALYFCDVTILTVGFGDLYPTTDLSRGLIFPYAVGGIIILGLVISSIYRFMRQIGTENIVQKRMNRMRERTIERTVSSSFDLRTREREVHHLVRKRSIRGKKISGPFQLREWRRKVVEATPNPLKMARKPRLILMREEKDRFDAMRNIQHRARKLKRWGAVMFSIMAFAILWCIGAVVFWRCERNTQGMTYFEALYFCYVSLLTVGYGDLAPKSNAGRCFFVVWSLIAVPTMTILVSDMGDTVVEKFKSWSSTLADFTVLPKEGIWRNFLNKHPWLLSWIRSEEEARALKKKVERGFETMDPEAAEVEEHGQEEENEEGPRGPKTTPESSRDEFEGGLGASAAEGQAHSVALEDRLSILAEEAERDVEHVPSPPALSRELALSIKDVASDLHLPTPKIYDYEAWVGFTRLIRLSWKPLDGKVKRASRKAEVASQEGGEEGERDQEEEEEPFVEWDWIGEDSPLVSGLTESQWLLNRLCEALVRVAKKSELEILLKEERRAKLADGESRRESEDTAVASGSSGGKRKDNLARKKQETDGEGGKGGGGAGAGDRKSECASGRGEKGAATERS